MAQIVRQPTIRMSVGDEAVTVHAANAARVTTPNIVLRPNCISSILASAPCEVVHLEQVQLPATVVEFEDSQGSQSRQVGY
jgi:hypothetical protein